MSRAGHRPRRSFGWSRRTSPSCPSCHAKRLAVWGLWLEETLLAPVPHRQVVLTIPKRLRAYGLYRRSLLGEIARVAARTVTAAIRATSGERDLSVGIIGCLQTHGSRANWHPHIHMIVTDGGFRPDGTFVHWATHDPARLAEAFRRAVLRLFVRKGLFEGEQAQAMLQWPHAGFHVHDAVWVAEDDRPFALRLARYCARNPVALERLTYEAATARVTYRSDKAEGPTAGSETLDALEFLARLVTHIPDPGQVLTHYYGWYANRTRGIRRRQVPRAETQPPVECAAPVPLPLREVRRRWAELLRRLFEVDPLACPRCGSAMRIVAFLTAPAVIDRILTHLRTRARAVRGDPTGHLRLGAGGRRDADPAARRACSAAHPGAGPAGALPVFPALLRSAGAEGWSRFQFVVDTTGRVEIASVREVMSTHPGFGMAVRGVLPRMRFVPAKVGGRRVRQLVEFPVVFRIDR